MQEIKLQFLRAVGDLTTENTVSKPPGDRGRGTLGSAHGLLR